MELSKVRQTAVPYEFVLLGGARKLTIYCVRAVDFDIVP